MRNIVLGLAAAGLMTGAAQAQSLSTATYRSVGNVVADNGKCGAVGLVKGDTVFNLLVYPGVSRTGFYLYTPGGGALQLCDRYPATPATGLNGWNVTAQCAIDTVNGDVKAQPVMFSFTSTTEDANTAIGTTTVSIPTTNSVGGGCVATVATTLIVSGH
jgi:hypothetical protein